MTEPIMGRCLKCNGVLTNGHACTTASVSTEFTGWPVRGAGMKELLKALEGSDLSPVQRKMAIILFRVNGIENAMLFVRRVNHGIEQKST